MIESDKGTVIVTFFIENFDAYDDLTLVVFEKAYLISGDEEILIASHEDIEDEDQTVVIPPHPVTPPDEEVPPQTGDNSNIFLWGGLAAASLISGTADMIGIRNTKKLEEERDAE